MSLKEKTCKITLLLIGVLLTDGGKSMGCVPQLAVSLKVLKGLSLLL